MLQRKSEKGQAIILIVFSIIGLVALTGLAVDGGRGYMDRRSAQGAADSAAWAAALAKARSDDFESAALSIADQNGYGDGVNSVVTVFTEDAPEGSCPVTGTDITVQIASNVNTLFGPVIGIEQMSNAVSATTRACDVYMISSDGNPLYAGHSVFATKTASCGNGLKDKSLYVQGSSQLQVWGGDMGSASTDGNCIDFKGGEAQLKKAESGTACADITTAAPSSEASDADFSSAKGQDGCGAHIFGQSFPPPPGDLGITCSGEAKKVGSTMEPGSYSGSFPPSGVSTLSPGVYCISGDFRVNANQKLTGKGVTIVLNSGELKWNGNSEVKLSAPTSGDTKGLLIYMPPGNTSPLDVNGNSNADIKGTVLAQNSDCFFAGSGQLQKQTLQFICSTWGMSGNGDAQLVYNSNAFYVPPPIIIDPTISLTK